MWGTDTETIPVIVGGLGTVSKNLGGFLTTIPGLPDLFMCQKVCLLGSKKIPGYIETPPITSSPRKQQIKKTQIPKTDSRQI